MTDQREREHAVERQIAEMLHEMADAQLESDADEARWLHDHGVRVGADAPPQDQDATRAEVERLKLLLAEASKRISNALAAQPPGAGEPQLEWHEHDPGKCSVCGAAFEWVRPGKSQATCDCWSICPVHGRGAIQYHPEGVRPNISGYYCLKCCTELVPASGGSTEPPGTPEPELDIGALLGWAQQYSMSGHMESLWEIHSALVTFARIRSEWAATGGSDEGRAGEQSGQGVGAAVAIAGVTDSAAASPAAPSGREAPQCPNPNDCICDAAGAPPGSLCGASTPAPEPSAPTPGYLTPEQQASFDCSVSQRNRPLPCCPSCQAVREAAQQLSENVQLGRLRGIDLTLLRERLAQPCAGRAGVPYYGPTISDPEHPPYHREGRRLVVGESPTEALDPWLAGNNDALDFAARAITEVLGGSTATFQHQGLNAALQRLREYVELPDAGALRKEE